MFDDHDVVIGDMLASMPPITSGSNRSGRFLELGNIHVSIRSAAQILGDPCAIDHHGIGHGTKGRQLDLSGPIKAVASVGILQAGLGTADAVAEHRIAFPPASTRTDGLLVCAPMCVADRIDMVHL